MIFHHDSHVHPGVGPVNGVRSFTFDIPTSGHDFEGNTSYEIVLKVTDSSGLQQSTSVFINPDKVNVSFDTVPSGLNVELDGITRTTPFVYDGLKGFHDTLNAPAQSSGGTAYDFTSWSDGGAQSHEIVVPDLDSSLVATYHQVGGPDTQPPTAPGNLAATAVGTSQINLSWTGVDRQRRRDRLPGRALPGRGLHDFAQIATPTGTTFNDTGLTARTSYSYRVRATDAAGNLSAYSTVASATTPAPRHAAADGAGRSSSATAVSGTADQSDLDGVDRQRRRHRVPGRALPGRRLHQLRADRDPDRNDLQRHRADAEHQLQLPRAGDRRCGQPQRLLERSRARRRRAPDTQPPTAPAGLVGDAVSARADQPQLDRRHRQRRRHRLPGRALPGDVLHHLRASSPRRRGPRTATPVWRRAPVTATACRASMRPATERVLDLSRRRRPGWAERPGRRLRLQRGQRDDDGRRLRATA